MKNPKPVTVPASCSLLSKEVEELGDIWRRTEKMSKGLAWALLEKLGGSCPRGAVFEGSHPAHGGDRAPCALPARGWIWQGGIQELLALCVTQLAAGRYLGQ